VSVLGILATLALSAAVTFPHGTAVIRTPGPTVRVRVEIAVTPAQLAQGLSGRRALAPGSGMAFLWTSDIRGRFWMKDTSIPLSIAFWNKSGRISGSSTWRRAGAIPARPTIRRSRSAARSR